MSTFKPKIFLLIEESFQFSGNKVSSFEVGVSSDFLAPEAMSQRHKPSSCQYIHN